MFSSKEAKCELQRRLEAGGAQLSHEVVKLPLRIGGASLADVAKGAPHRRALEAAVAASVTSVASVPPELITLTFLEASDGEEGVTVVCVLTPPGGAAAAGLCGKLISASTGSRGLRSTLERQLAVAGAEVTRIVGTEGTSVKFSLADLGSPAVVTATYPAAKIDKKLAIPNRIFALYEELRVLDDARGIPGIKNGAPQVTGDEVRWALKQTADMLKDPQLENLVKSVVGSLRRKSRSSCNEWACLVSPSALQSIMFDNPVRRDIFAQPAGGVHAQQQRLRAYTAEIGLCVALAVVAADALRSWTESLDQDDRVFLTEALAKIGTLPELAVSQARGLFDRVIGRYVIMEALVLSSDSALQSLAQMPQDILRSVFKAPWLGIGREMSFLHLYPSIALLHGNNGAAKALDVIARSFSSPEALSTAAKAFLEDGAFDWSVRTDFLVCLMSACRRGAGCPQVDGLELNYLQVVIKAGADIPDDSAAEGNGHAASEPLAEALQAVLLVSSGDHLWHWAQPSPSQDFFDLDVAKRFLFAVGSLRLAGVLREASRRFGNLYYNEDKARKLVEGTSKWMLTTGRNNSSFSDLVKNAAARQHDDFGQLLWMYIRLELALGGVSLWRFVWVLEEGSDSIAANLSNLAPEGSILRMAIAKDFLHIIGQACPLNAGEISGLLSYVGFFNPSFQRFLRDADAIQKVQSFVSNVGFRGGLFAMLEASVKLMGREEEPYIGDILVQVIDFFGLNAVSWALFGRVVQAVQHGEERRFSRCGATGAERFGLEGLRLCAKEMGKAGQVLQDKVARASSEDLLDKVERTLEPLLSGSPPDSWASAFQTLDTVIFTLEYTAKEDLSLAYSCFQEECKSCGHEMVEDLLRCVKKVYVQPFSAGVAGLDSSTNLGEAIKARAVAMEKHVLWHGIAFEPSDWLLAVDIAAAAAEAMTAKYNVQMLPHHTQIICMLMFAIRACGAGALGAGFGNLPKTMLARVGTGEGKSLIIGMLAAFVAKKGLRAHVVNDSRILTTRDFETNKAFFETLGIRASCRPADLKNRTVKIVYCTGDDVEGSCLDCLIEGRGEEYEQALKESVLIVDEVDGLIFDKGATTERLFEDGEFSSMVHDWMVEYHQKGDIVRDEDDFRTQDEVSAVLLRDLLGSLREASTKQEGKDYAQRGELLYLIDQKTKKVQESGWALWLEILKNQRSDGNYSVKYKYVKAIISRIQCFMSYSCIFGLTGSLGQSAETKFLADHYEAVTFKVPFFLDTCRSDSLGKFKKVIQDVSPSPHPFTTVPEQEQGVIDLAIAHCTDVPVLVLVRDTEAVHRLAAALRAALKGRFGGGHCDSQAGVLELLYNPQKPQEFVQHVVAATEPLHAGLEDHVGQAWRITLTTAEGGRGHDYRVTDPSIDQCGGLLLILTWVPWSEREWIQFIGRTGRQDHKGQYAVFLDGQDARVKDAGKDVQPGETLAQAILRQGDREADVALKSSAEGISKGRLMHRLTSRYWSLYMQDNTTKIQNWEWKRLCEDHHRLGSDSIQKMFDESFPPHRGAITTPTAKTFLLDTDTVSRIMEAPRLASPPKGTWRSEPLTMIPDLTPRRLACYQDVEAAIELYWNTVIVPTLPKSQGVALRGVIPDTRKTPRNRGDLEPDDLEVEGAGAIRAPTAQPQIHYWLREVHFFGGQRRVLLDEARERNALVAICNVLLLRGQVAVSQDVFSATTADLLAMVNNLLLDVHSASLAETDQRSERIRQSLMACLDLLPSLSGELAVDVRFTRPKDFEHRPELLIFELLDISLVHGWLVSEDDPAFSAVGLHSATSLKAAAANKSAGGAKAAREFLDRPDGQLTLEGIIRLHEVVQDRELAVIYRDGHYIPVLKHQDELLTLCAESGSDILWQRLVDGDYLDDHFRSRPGMP